MELKQTAIREPLTKAKLHTAIAEDTGLAKKDVANVFAALENLMHRHLKPRGAGVFTLPGILKVQVAKKKATKAREGVNPRTGEPMTIAAKPARKVVKVRPLKGLKEMID